MYMNKSSKAINLLYIVAENYQSINNAMFQTFDIEFSFFFTLGTLCNVHVLVRFLFFNHNIDFVSLSRSYSW